MIQSSFIKNKETIPTINRKIFSRAMNKDIFFQSFFTLTMSFVRILIISNIHKTIIVLYTKTLYGVSSSNIYQNIKTLIDHKKAANTRYPQYLLKENFFKSMLHNIRITHAANVNKNEIKLLSVNNINQKITVKIVSNSQ
jgi:hypothetical protein